MKKIILLIGCLISLSLMAGNPVLEAHVCQADKFLAGCDVFSRADGDKTGVPVDIGGVEYSLNLTWGIPAEFPYSDSVAVGGKYIFNCQVLDGPGEYRDTLVTATGCDSIVILTLTEYTPVPPCKDTTIEYTDSVAVGGKYIFNCQVLTEAGIYTETLTKADGCDSIVVLTLTEYTPIPPCEEVTFEYTDSIAVGGTYIFNCQVLTEAGEYKDTLIKADGCDSIVVLTLTEYSAVIINDTLRDTVSVTLCLGESFTDRLDVTYYPTQDTVVLDTVMIRRDTTLTLIHTVDSIYRYEITVQQPKDSLTTATICAGESFRWFGNDYSVADTYFDTLRYTTGCDSICGKLVLNVLPAAVDEPTQYDTILVDNLPYIWPTYTGKTIECYTEGTYRDTVKNILGCDSVRYTLELAIIAHDTVTLPVEAKLCHGESYTSRLQTVTPYFVGDTTFSDIVPSIMMEPLLMRDSIYAYTLHVQSRYVDNLPALIKYKEWLLMIHRRSIREDYGINFTADQVHWYKVVGEVDEYPYGEDNDTEVGTGDYHTVGYKMSGQYYALIDVDVTWIRPCAKYARTVILDCDNPQPVGPVLSPTYVTPGGLMKLTNLTQGETNLNVFTPAGQLIRTEKVMTATEHELQAEGVCGFYLLQVDNGGQKYVFKYVVTQ